MKKMLYILNIANRVNNFSYTSMKAAQELGYEYHIAGNWSYANDQERITDEKKYGIHIYQIDFIRTPYHPGNIKAYKQLKEIVEREQFDVIHCNTPIGGIVGRLVGKSCKVPTIIYQAHGFHFYKGAPLFNWLVYYPIEKVFAKYTDILITINKEDFDLAKKFHLRNNGNVYYVPGVGIDLDNYVSDINNRELKRKEMGINDEIVLISMGDLIKRKNYETAIRALCKCNCNNLIYWICGVGPQESALKQLSSKLGISDRVRFLGFRNDVKELLNAADVFILTSFQEGLPRSTSEAMASGLPCLTSNIRGNTDLIDNGNGGRLLDSKDINGFASVIDELAGDLELRKRMKDCNLKRIKSFDTQTVIREIEKIYRTIDHSVK